MTEIHAFRDSTDAPVTDRTLTLDPTTEAERPVFVAEHPLRDRLVRASVVAGAVLAVLWVVAVGAGLLGFRPLPQLPLVAGDPPADAAPARDSISERTAGRRLEAAAVGDDVPRAGSAQTDASRDPAGTLEAGNGSADDGADAVESTGSATGDAGSAATETVDEQPGSSEGHAATDTAPDADAPGQATAAESRDGAGSQSDVGDARRDPDLPDRADNVR